VLEGEKYMLLTTFKRDATPVASPVWLVDVGDDRVGFWTSSGSGKVKRLAHTDRVIVQACDARGRTKAGSAPLAATAEVVEGPELDVIRAKVKEKYGFVTHITKLLGTVGGLLKGKRIPYGDRGVVVSPTA
jgi:uncharacterized protein